MTTPTDIPTSPGAEIIDITPKLGKGEQRRADARWGKSVMARGYTIVPALLIRAQHRLGLSPEHFNVLVQLAYHWWDANEDPHPSKRLIASRMDRSEKQVQRYLKELETAKLIQRIGRYQAGRGQTSNGYDLSGLVERLQAIAAEDAVVAKENTERRSKVERRSDRRGAS